MINQSFKFLSALSLLMVAFASYGQTASAQDHFIGEGQSVNRVIKLRSTPTTKSVPKRAVNETSRGDRAARATKAVASPNDIQFDEIQVPLALQNQFKPMVRKPATTAAPKIAESQPQARLAEVVRESNAAIVVKNNQISTEIHAPRFVNVNQPLMMQVKLHNVGVEKIDNAKLITVLPAHAKFVSSTPKPTKVDGQRLVFDVMQLEGERSQSFEIKVVPTQKLPMEISTQIVMENLQRMVVAVQQPQLAVKIQGPSQTTTGKSVSHTITVTNVGDGIATDVQMDTLLPSQLQSSMSTVAAIERLEPGQSVDVQLDSRALTPGEGQLKIVANSVGTQPEEAALDMVVFQPELRLSAVGPKINFVERDGIYSINVENTGEVDVTNVNVSLMVPDGMKVTTISRQADVDAATGMLTWSFDSLAAKTNEQIQLKATALKEGQQVCNIRIRSDETLDKEFALATQVSTRADLSVRIKNQTGPVQVGAQAEFIVEVENHGSRRANDVNVNVTLPESLMPVKDGGTNQFKNSIVFKQSMVEPGEKVAFKFSAVGVASGDQVVRSTLQLAGSERQVISEDSVYVYEVNETRVSEALSPVIPR